jgi:hypothetical protein
MQGRAVGIFSGSDEQTGPILVCDASEAPIAQKGRRRLRRGIPEIADDDMHVAAFV